jgi:all-trans-retinol 13,14-reductase
VIGSGMGGLTAASLLARLAGARVLLLERHYRLGGLLHEFSRPDGGRWSVGLHYVGKMRPGGRLRAIMDVVTDGMEWAPLPDPHERYIYPGLTFDQPVGEHELVAALSDRWPAERSGILRYFATVQGATRLLRSGRVWGAEPAGRSTHRPAYAHQTTGRVLGECVRDEMLRTVLASQWGDYGFPPSRSSFLAHAVTVEHYLDGGWVPVGGTAPLIGGARDAVEAAGGECRTSTEVTAITVEGDRATGVELRRSSGGQIERVRAPLVISDAGARITFEHLLAACPLPEIRRVRGWLCGLPPGYTVVQLFLALDASPAGLGVRGENVWIFDGPDHDEAYRRRDEILEGRAQGVFVSFPSLRDPAAADHTVEVVAPISARGFRRWAGHAWRRRGAEYEGLKQRMSEALIGLVDRHLPGLAAAIRYRELATPLSIEHFTRHPGGAAYGLPAVPARFGGPLAGAATPVRGLLLAGSDAALHGVAGAMMGGVAAVSEVLGPEAVDRGLLAAAAGGEGRRGDGPAQRG